MCCCCRLDITGFLNISYEPIVIGTDLNLGPDSVTVITPTNHSTLFMVAEGTAAIDGTLVVDLSGRNYTATYTTIAVIRAGQLQGGYQTITLDKRPQGYASRFVWCFFFFFASRWL